MNNRMLTKSILAPVIAVLFLVLQGCASSGPKTQYYSLFPAEYSASDSDSGFNQSIGIGPIDLPEYINHSGIVSLTGTNQITVSGYNAWAGDLAENLSRIIASNLSSQLGAGTVSAFPWDNRVRPDYQIRVAFQEFAGVRGGTVKLKAKWTVLDKKGSKVVLAGVEDLEEQAPSSSYNDYVGVLNQLVNNFSDRLAREIKQFDGQD